MNAMQLIKAGNEHKSRYKFQECITRMFFIKWRERFKINYFVCLFSSGKESNLFCIEYIEITKIVIYFVIKI